MSKNQFSMDIEKEKHKACSAFPDIQWIEVKGEKKGVEFIKLRHRNENNPKFPIVITFYEHEGVFLGIGERISIIECEKSFDDFITERIRLILDDRIIICTEYSNEKSFQMGDYYKYNLWFDTSDDYNDITEYYDYLMCLTRPSNVIERITKSFKVIEISDWSGKRYMRFIRKKGIVSNL